MLAFIYLQSSNMKTIKHFFFIETLLHHDYFNTSQKLEFSKYNIFFLIIDIAY